MRNKCIGTGRVAAAVVVVSEMLLGGCASMMRSGTQQVLVNSNPPGAEAIIDDRQRIITPATVDLTRVDDHRIVIRKPGYRDATVTLTSGTSGLILGNIIFGGIVGSNIDASTGAGRELSTDAVDVSLIPIGGPDADAPQPRGDATPPSPPP